MIIEETFFEVHPVLRNIPADAKKILNSKMEKAKIALATLPKFPLILNTNVLTII
ncbi:hypothetical protein MGH68_16305 [Erysipelothrix sp. D19-032]